MFAQPRLNAACPWLNAFAHSHHAYLVLLNTVYVYIINMLLPRDTPPGLMVNASQECRAFVWMLFGFYFPSCVLWMICVALLWMPPQFCAIIFAYTHSVSLRNIFPACTNVYQWEMFSTHKHTHISLIYTLNCEVPLSIYSFPSKRWMRTVRALPQQVPSIWIDNQQKNV